MYKLNIRIEDSTGYMNVVLFGTVMQILLGVAYSELTTEGDYMDGHILPPIIEQQIGQSKIFVLYFRTRGALIDAIIFKKIYDDEVATPAPSLLIPSPSNPVTSSSRTSSIRYKDFSISLL